MGFITPAPTKKTDPGGMGIYRSCCGRRLDRMRPFRRHRKIPLAFLPGPILFLQAPGRDGGSGLRASIFLSAGPGRRHCARKLGECRSDDPGPWRFGYYHVRFLSAIGQISGCWGRLWVRQKRAMRTGCESIVFATPGRPAWITPALSSTFPDLKRNPSNVPWSID